MRRYDPKAKCPKCGHDDIGTHYADGGYLGCLYGCPDRYRDGTEHMDRNCRRCGYLWVEAALAAHKEEK